MSESDFPRSASDGHGWLIAQTTHDADPSGLPFEVRGMDDTVVAWGLTGQPLEIPLGHYLITARDPEGVELTADNLVDIPLGGHAIARLQAPERRSSAALRTLRAAVHHGFQADDQGPEPVAIKVRFQHADDPLLALLGSAGTASSIVMSKPWAKTGQEPVRETFESSAVVEIEMAADRHASMRTRVVVPVDHGPDRSASTVLSIARSPRAALGVGAELASPEEGHRFPYDFDLEFSDSRLQRFWLFITRAAFREAWASSEALAPKFEQSGTDWMKDKLHSPVGATLGAYVLLRANRLERLEVWSEHLVNRFPTSPDALVIRAEVLSRRGEHGLAAQLLSSLGNVGCPWMRSGLQYAWQMASIYSETQSQDELQVLDETAFTKLVELRRALGRLSGAVDPRRLNTVFDWRYPERRSASSDPGEPHVEPAPSR